MKLLIPILIATLPAFACAAIDAGQVTTATPYDAYLQPVRTVLQHCDKQSASMEQVRSLMSTAAAFRYVFEQPYRPQTPGATAQRHAGDCKDKALWLCHELGDPSVRFVIGKLHAESVINHAWLYWQKDGHWWILDPTNSDVPIDADAAPDQSYLPLYSFHGRGKFMHGAALMATGREGTRSQVASRR